jgi:hypothetical protein
MVSYVVAVMALAITIAVPSAAQVSTGRIDAIVADTSGAVLTGAEVEISGPERHTASSDPAGEVHFLNLAPGTYSVRAKMAGFNDYLNRRVVVGAGTGAPLKIALWIAGVATQVQVIAEAPVVDVRKMTTSTNVTLEQLQNIPSARDPWVVLQSIPAVIVDRVNVGGAESGQQSNYQAKGATVGDNTWNIDGIAVTDMAATGSTPAYYDFDMFQEIQVTTGGADVMSATPGVQLNMVLKSGTNTPRGTARIYFENEALQANNVPADLAGVLGGTSGKGNRIDEYKDYGFELGGPIVKDRLWAWGAAAKTDVDLIVLTGAHDRTELQDTSFKATGQVTPGLRTNFTFFRGDKQKFGRGASVTRPPETTYDQKGPTSLYKGEGNFVVGSTMFLSAKGARTNGGFSLIPKGGADANWYIDDAGVSHGTVDTLVTDRHQSNVSVDANAFRGRHELKFGAGWRKADVTTTDTYPGNGIITFHIGYPSLYALVKRDYAASSDTVYTSAYGGDTVTLGRLTLDFGVRWDRQAGSLGASSVPASRALPALLQPLTATPVKNAIVWNSVTPRAGITYALNQSGKTIARATYAMFASQMGSAEATIGSAIQYTGIYYYAVDLNGNRSADANELQLGLGHAGYYGFDPSNPGRRSPLNQIGNYATPRAHEVTFGGDHELMPNFGLNATFTYRYYDRFDWRGGSLIGVSSSDYVQTGTLTGSADPIGSFSVPFYALLQAKVPPGGGRSYEERTGYHQRYLGFEASAVKRLSNKWMARFGFSTNSHREYFAGAEALDDPTPSPGAPRKNGGLVLTPTAGSGKSNIYMVLPRYQVIANGMYQLPYGINVAGNWVMRQGYAEPFYRSAVPTGDPLARLKNVLVSGDVGADRLPVVRAVDARVEKILRFGEATLALDLDVFNISNAPTTLGRQYDLRAEGPFGFNQTLEILNPRIFRVGARIVF